MSKAKQSIWTKWKLKVLTFLFPSEYKVAKQYAKNAMRKVKILGWRQDQLTLEDEIAKAIILFKYRGTRNEVKAYYTENEMCAFAHEFYRLKIEESEAVEQNLKNKKKGEPLTIAPVNVWQALDAFGKPGDNPKQYVDGEAV